MRFAGPAVAAEWLSFPRTRTARGTGGPIHGPRCGVSGASDIELCLGNCNSAIDKGSRRNGIRPLFRVFT
jgi:hypothetical protein